MRLLHRLFLFLALSGQVAAQNPDIDLLRHINLDRNRRLDGTFKAVSASVLPASLAVPLGVLGAGLLTRDPALRGKGWEAGAAVALNAGLTLGLKYAVNRPRPYITHPGLDNAATEADPSFPSGHTSFAFATATTLSLSFPKWYVAVPAYLWAGGVGYSRMHLGVHYPTDVLAGAVTGAGGAWLTHRAHRWLARRRPGGHAPPRQGSGFFRRRPPPAAARLP